MCIQYIYIYIYIYIRVLKKNIYKYFFLKMRGFPKKYKNKNVLIQEILEQGMNTLLYVPNLTSLNHCLLTLQPDIFVFLLCMMRELPIFSPYYLSIHGWGGGGGGFRGVYLQNSKRKYYSVIYP